MVAARLADVGGGGQAFRCGGEEFAILFRNTSAKEAFDRLDVLRQTIQNSIFRFRGSERRNETRAGETERRQPDKKKAGIRKPGTKKTGTAVQSPVTDLSVTISIGVAEPSTRYRQPEQVIQAADQALYRAKELGRNCAVIASDEQRDNSASEWSLRTS